MRNKLSFILIASLVLTAQQGLCQEWIVPSDKSSVSNPSEYNLENIKKGKEIYTRNCKSCHGDPGKNNPLALVPTPIDMASEKMHLNTEGDMFYKISIGRGVMPPFESTLSPDDRWKLINFIMNYKPGGKSLLVDAPSVKASLLASINEGNSKVEILAEHENNGLAGKGLAGAPVIISAKKTFGNLELGRTITNENGRAEFVVPSDLIGDEEGFASIVVSLGDGFEAREVALEKISVGKKKHVPKLIKGEVLWSTNKNIQLWLLFSYIAAAGGAWLVIAYVIFQITKIKKYSRTA